MADRIACGPIEHDASSVEHESPLAERSDRAHIVTDEEDGSAGARHLAHPPETLPLKRRITDG